MPAEYQPSWNALSEERQEEIVRTSKAYLPGAANYVSRALKGEWKSTASFTVRVNNVSKVLRWLGYSEKEVEDMMPALTNNKSTFNSKLDAIEEALLWQYNSIRQNRWMPNMTIDALIWKQSLSDLYRIWDLQSIRDASSWARNMNLNLRNASWPAWLNTSSEAMRII